MTKEDTASETIEKAYWFYEVDPTLYDLYFNNINICRTEWDFNTNAGETIYRFKRKSWLDRRKALFTLKYHDIGLTDVLKREMIYFI